MTQIRSRQSLLALWLSATLLVAAGTSAVTLGAKGEAEPAEAQAAEASEAPPEPTPEPTPFPAFDPSTVTLRTDLFVDGLDAPVYLADDGVPGKCVYIVERGGTVQIVESDGYVRPRPFLDLRDVVARGPEQGLHAIAFHPQFKKNGRVFVHYNSAIDGSSVVAEYKGSPCRPASKKPVKTLLTVDQPFPNNNGGWLGFGPDGFLYITLGDGGGVSPGDPNGYGQAASPRLAKVLRINVNKGKLYAIPKDNPYAKKPKGFPRETWAMGLRDPRRASFDRATGDLWIGDVGQDRYEEVHRIPAGVAPLNFGWSHVEGATSCHPNVPDCDPSLYEPPVYFYDQVPPHRAITGGYVYRGKAVPELDGRVPLQ